MATIIERNLHFNDTRRIIADPAPEGYDFIGWEGDIDALDNPSSMEAIVTMPEANVTVEAKYAIKQLSAINYGILYNWYAATDLRNISNNGWHVPTQSDIETLQIYLDPTIIHPVNPNIAGGFLKEIGTTYWQEPNIGATNSTKFNARAAGTRADGHDAYYAGTFDCNILASLFMWTSTSLNESNAHCCYVETWSANFYCWNDYGKSGGMSIRLIKDSTTLTHGQSGTYIGNDGKLYRTICIGTQEWVSDNLIETKYRNGDWIHGYDGGIYTPITNENWAALTSGALCYYNNDINNV